MLQSEIDILVGLFTSRINAFLEKAHKLEEDAPWSEDNLEERLDWAREEAKEIMIDLLKTAVLEARLKIQFFRGVLPHGPVRRKITTLARENPQERDLTEIQKIAEEIVERLLPKDVTKNRRLFTEPRRRP